MSTAKQVITDMIEVLNSNTREAEQLWDIITSLRGPDSSSNPLKDVTTTRIRGALGLTMNSDFAVVSKKSPTGSDDPALDLDFFLPKLKAEFGGSVQYHFVAHYIRALRALQAFGYLPDPRTGVSTSKFYRTWVNTNGSTDL